MHVSFNIDGETFKLGGINLVGLIQQLDGDDEAFTLLEKMSEHPDILVRRAISARKKLSPITVTRLLEDDDKQIRNNIALYHLSSSGITCGGLMKWIDGDYLEQIIMLAGCIDQISLSQDDLKELIERLSSHASPIVRLALARCTRLEDDVLRKLLADEDEQVTQRAAISLSIKAMREHNDSSDCMQLDNGRSQPICDLMLSNYKELEGLYACHYKGSGDKRFHWEEAEQRVKTGILDVDLVTGGMRRKEIMLLAGMAGGGTTSIALGVSLNQPSGINDAEKEAGRVALFSLKHVPDELSMRMLCMHSGVNWEHMRAGALRASDWRGLASSSGFLAESRIEIMHEPYMSIFEIQMACHRIVEKMKGLDLIVIDSIDLMNRYGDQEKRHREFDEIARGLTELAETFDVPVLLTVSLQTPIEGNADFLEWSKEIYHAADSILLLNRTDKQATLRLSKHLTMPPASVSLKFDPGTMKFISASRKPKLSEEG